MDVVYFIFVFKVLGHVDRVVEVGVVDQRLFLIIPLILTITTFDPLVTQVYIQANLVNNEN